MEKVVRLSPAASTKFQAPTNDDGLVQRDRLIALLREGRSRRLTLIHAPAGFGKTTLAVQWQRVLRDEGVPVLAATGLGQVFELTEQLRGRAGSRQVEGAGIAIAENGGGFHNGEEAAASVVILARSPA